MYVCMCVGGEYCREKGNCHNKEYPESQTFLLPSKDNRFTTNLNFCIKKKNFFFPESTSDSQLFSSSFVTVVLDLKRNINYT